MPAARLAARAFRPRQKLPVVFKRGTPHYVKPNGKLVNAARSDAQKFGTAAKKKRAAVRQTNAASRRRSDAAKRAADTRKRNKIEKLELELNNILKREQVANKKKLAIAARVDKHRVSPRLETSGRRARRLELLKKAEGDLKRAEASAAKTNSDVLRRIGEMRELRLKLKA